MALFKVFLDEGLNEFPYGHLFVYGGVFETFVEIFTDIGDQAGITTRD